ncbi:winged helix-turn-helix transcriptional regulator [Bifidobacterium tsurumiense]|uniref:HxlR family transcriptional regulator n=1 Tax=Bifidobacterium tsurumiense TaxID=356829 RepID=A0A087EGK4_9BIFI|nr:helix-turn-helix domain-containing protein [Bifidobacterium tsurumiense]KFJ06905.1 HxlR family transcriptional regulator [Bifidobacterium tsurumiense]
MTQKDMCDGYENPQNYNVFAAQCPSRKLLTDATRRWSILVLAALLGQSRRFGQLRSDVEGISDRMLSQTLGLLVEDGLVARDDSGDAPIYSLTEPGKTVAQPTAQLFTAIYQALDQMPEGDTLSA